MIKLLDISVCFVFILFSLFNCSGIEVPTDARVIKATELPEPAYEAWSQIQDHWIKTNLGHCTKKYQLRMNCESCPAILIKVQLHIDEQGKLIHDIPVKENICGAKATREMYDCFLQPLQSIKYPEALFSKSFEALLGTGLRC